MSTRRIILAATLAAAAFTGAGLCPADPPPDAPAASPAESSAQAAPEALSPAVQKAIANLGAEDYKTRQSAVKNLEIALGEQMHALIASDDPEIQSRIISLLQFNDGLSRWMIDVYKLPAQERNEMIKFGLQPKILPLLALVFSADSDKRVEAAHELAKIDQSEATELLGRLLQDDDRAVYVAAMEAVWDKKPTEAVIDALWDRAVEAGTKVYRGNYVQRAQQNLKFRGKSLPVVNFYDGSQQRRMQDSSIATDVLIHFKSPKVNDRIKGFLEDYEKATSSHGQNTNIWIYTSNNEPMQNAIRLIGAYKTKDSIKMLYKIATNPPVQQSQGNMNGQKYFWSSRTTALATLIEVLDLKPEDYKLKRQNIGGGIWTTSTADDEKEAVKTIQKYWAAHADKLGDPLSHDPDAKGDAATQPAAARPGADTKPADKPIEKAPDLILRKQMLRANLQVAPATAPAND